MLKACWDCLVGDATRTEEPYGTQLNGNISRAPPWPTSQLPNEKMFILPKPLSSNDKIFIQGQTYEGRRQLTIGLVTGSVNPDHSNVACQLDIRFNDPDKIAIQTIEDGNANTVNDENAASEYFSDPLSFRIGFHILGSNMVAVYIEESYLESIQLKHQINDIRFLSVYGDVNKVSSLDFSFG